MRFVLHNTQHSTMHPRIQAFSGASDERPGAQRHFIDTSMIRIDFELSRTPGDQGERTGNGGILFRTVAHGVVFNV
jgi:hypothetical protein